MFSFPLNDNDNLDDSILVVIDTFDSVDGGCGLRFSYSVRQLDTDEQLYDILNGRNSSNALLLPSYTDFWSLCASETG